MTPEQVYLSLFIPNFLTFVLTIYDRVMLKYNYYEKINYTFQRDYQKLKYKYQI